MVPACTFNPRVPALRAGAVIAFLAVFSPTSARTDAAAPAASLPSSPALLAGVWNFDAAKSDSAQLKMDAMRRSGMRGPRGGGGFGGGMGGGPRGGGMRGGGMGGGRPPGEAPGEGERQPARGPEMRLMMRPPASMLIEQTDSTVVLFEQGLPIEVLVLGLPQDRAGAISPEVPHVVASWSGNTLIAIREDERGGRATQHFVLAPDGRSFTLTLRREPRDDRPPLEIRREYRREE